VSAKWASHAAGATDALSVVNDARMALDPPHHDFQRARSDAQQQERRRDILVAARQHLADAGVEGFSMARLGAAAGVSRAALDEYFANREEVLLAVYLEESQAWLDELVATTTPDMATEAFLRAVFTSATRRPPFMELAPRMSDVIESNVSTERLTESKRMAATLVDVAGRRAALALKRPVAQGAELSTGLFALMLGVAQAWRSPDVDVTLLPPDVQQMMEGEAAVDAFVRLGAWMVSGAR
jgi:AcrR family transcriptional regulator